MKIRRFFGKDMREALRLVKEELGEDAVIMSNRKVADGVELVAAYDKEPNPAIKPTKAAAEKPVPSLSEIIGDDGPDSLKALLEQQAKFSAASASVNAKAPEQATPPPRLQPERRIQPEYAPEMSEPLQDLQIEEPVAESMASNEITEIKDELSALRELLQHQVADLMDAKQQRQRPQQNFVSKQLVDLGLSYPLANQLVDFIPAGSNERDAGRYALQLLMNRICVAGHDLLSKSGVVAFLGPTGTGKTTTLAKLAAQYAKKYGSDSIALLTIDTFRIGAFEQLQTYGKVIGCVVRQAASGQELADMLFQLRHKRMIFIDTAGFSQRDSRLIKQLEQFNNTSMAVNKYLVLQANTQYPALEKAVQAYGEVPLEGCILTKLDECYSLGEALSTVVEHKLPLSYVTDGQNVPEDIQLADAKSLVSVAAKLYKKYGLNHTSRHNSKTTSHAV